MITSKKNDFLEQFFSSTLIATQNPPDFKKLELLKWQAT